MALSASKIITTGLLLTVIQECTGAVSCPSGDTAGVIKDGQTCAQLVTESTKRECYNSTVETSCCTSCNAVATSLAGCTYGDGMTGCLSFLCAIYINTIACCETCYTPVSTTTTATTTAATTTAATTTAAAATTTTTAANPALEQSNDDSKVGAIVGGVVGGVAGVALVGGGIYGGFILYKKYMAS